MTGTPYLVTAPASDPVSLADMKVHLRVDHDDEDAAIEAYQAGAVAYLDAHGGVLGRCIMPQTWAVDVTGPGPHLLPFPDASNVTAISGDDSLAATVERSSMGPLVTVSDALPDQAVTIQAAYGLPAERLPAAQALIKLLVGAWYENREAVAASSVSELPMAAGALISALQWRRL